MKKKNLLRSFCIVSGLLSLSACQSGDPSLGGLIGPKRTVPSFDAPQVPETIMEESLPPDQEAATDGGNIPGQGQSGTDESEAGLLDAQFVFGRLSYYQEKRQKWQSLAETVSQRDVALPHEGKWNACLLSLNGLEKSYSVLTQVISGEPVSGSRTDSSFVVLQNDIDFLQSDCESVFSTAAALLPGQVGRYGEIAGDEADRVVLYWAQQGENEKVVSAYEDLAVVTEGREPSLQAREVYALALKTLGHLEKALPEMLKVADEKGVLQGFPLRMQAAELLFAQGNFAEARRQYEKIAALFAGMEEGRVEVESQLHLLAGEKDHPWEIDLYRRALRGWLLFDGKIIPPELANSVLRLEQSFPASDYAIKGRALFDKVGGSVQQYFRQEILNARNLAERKMFDQALSVLAGLAENAGSDELLSLVRQNQLEIEQMQGQEYTVEQERQKQEVESKWKAAVEFFDHRQYDRAITAFKDLLHSEYGEQAEIKLNEAVNMAASEMRKEAAALFLKSRKGASPQQQASLLMESRFLLLSILEKYPEADVVEKVKQNLNAAEEQIRVIDPSLLQ